MRLVREDFFLTMVCLTLAGSSSAVGQTMGDASRGLAYAQRACAECHAVSPSQPISPRPGVTPFIVIANAPGMTSTAILVWLQTPHPTMPNLMIDADDKADVIAYIASLKEVR